MKKTTLKVISVILLILGILTLIGGLLLLAGLHESAALSVLVVIYILSGVFNIFAGVFGLNAAKDAHKKTPALVMGTLAFLNGLASIILSPSIQSVCAFIIPLIYFICVIRLDKNEQ